jgi:hypothetical protein
MIVPGASGLMAIVGSGVDPGGNSLESVVVTVIAIALGILTGTALFHSLSRVPQTLVRRSSSGATS